LTFITQRRLTLQLELGRLQFSYWCLCCWEERLKMAEFPMVRYIGF